MEVIIHDTPERVAGRAADIVTAFLKQKPDAVLGLATGSTPVALYRELIKRCAAGEISFAGVTTFNLDEYVGLPPDHPQSYRAFMNRQLFDHIDIDPAKTHVPDGMMENPMQCGPQYEDAIARAGGIDLQLLGIGSNGHIGFNEPTSSLGSRTRVKTLTKRTIADNRRFFSPQEFQPHLAITMGVATILEARRILLLATGESKARAVADAVEGPLSAMVPASAMQMHPRATVVLDREAAAQLRMSDYYEYVLTEQDALTERFGSPPAET